MDVRPFRSAEVIVNISNYINLLTWLDPHRSALCNIVDNAKNTNFAQLRDAVGASLSPAKLSATQKRCRQWMQQFEKRKPRE